MDALSGFSVAVRTWFNERFREPTRAQTLAFPPIRAGRSTLVLAPTGSGKTLTAFLSSLDRMMTGPGERQLRVVYVSPLKSLAADIEQNLQAPIDGIQASASRLGLEVRAPRIAIRTGDTSSKERARFVREGAELLITTPESLYLLMTSQAARHFSAVDTVIIDELHSLLPTKRGAHLLVTLERLEACRTATRPMQRIGLSATLRPAEEAARFLGGAHQPSPEVGMLPRLVEVLDASLPPLLNVSVRGVSRSGSLAQATRSSWPDIFAPLLALIREHRSTLIFVNSRRLAERLAQSVNELADAELVLTHHGSLATDRRRFVEESLRSGALRALVTTSSLELGIDMGAIDLVVQIDAPASVTSGLQRIGRAGHQVGAVSKGVFFAKHRGELLATAAAVEGMRTGSVESTRFPRNPLDVLAQQVVAISAGGPILADHLFALCRRAASFTDLPRAMFDSVLALLSGHYPSDEFAELRPRITWERTSGWVTARAGAKRIAVTSSGTIADRGLYGVFLSDSQRPVRVGELDEEMVFESRIGEVFLLGATSWRIDEITHDRVLVSAVPGQPGKMPFWKGAGPGRSVELGRRIGELTRELVGLPADRAEDLLSERHGFDDIAGIELVRYLNEQQEATGVVPSDKTIVIERYKDETSGYRVCILSPWGKRVHAPWALALTERFRTRLGTSIDAVWSDDGIAFRLPETTEQLATEQFVFDTRDLEALVVAGLSSSSLFAAYFRENAGRALLLPKRTPGRRQPLWFQRRRSSDLLRVASRYPDFPILQETYRECLNDTFDLPALTELFSRIRSRDVGLSFVESKHPSPFASTVLFSYVGNFLYEGDAPLEERKAQALALAQASLHELWGEAGLRTLLCSEVIRDLEARLQRLSGPPLRHADDIHDFLLFVGDRTASELAQASSETTQLPDALEALLIAHRIYVTSISGEPRYVAAEDAGKLRDALGASPAPGIADAFLAACPNALRELLARYARTHGPFLGSAPGARYNLDPCVVEDTLRELERAGRVVRGEFLPNGTEPEWCDASVLRQIRQLSLAKVRRAIEPVDKEAFVRHLLAWQGVVTPSRAVDALDAAIGTLQGYPVLASELTDRLLGCRVAGFVPAILDASLASGEVTWIGLEPLGATDGRIALYRTEALDQLAPPPTLVPGAKAESVRSELGKGGALFFSELLRRIGGFPPELLKTIWDMVWSGEVTNDTLIPFRSLRAESAQRGGRPNPRARRPLLPGSEGRWSLVRRQSVPQTPERTVALATQILDRYGMACRDILAGDGGWSFSELYPAFRVMEDRGTVRRGYFVRGLSATQYAHPDVFEQLRRPAEEAECAVLLASTDPANPYGAILPWPDADPRPMRVAGATVVIHHGRLLAYLVRGGRALTIFFRSGSAERELDTRVLVSALENLARSGTSSVFTIDTINGEPARLSDVAAAFQSAGFTPCAMGLSWRAGLLRKPETSSPPAPARRPPRLE